MSLPSIYPTSEHILQQERILPSSLFLCQGGRKEWSILQTSISFKDHLKDCVLSCFLKKTEIAQFGCRGWRALEQRRGEHGWLQPSCLGMTRKVYNSGSVSFNRERRGDNILCSTSWESYIKGLVFVWPDSGLWVGETYVGYPVVAEGKQGNFLV